METLTRQRILRDIAELLEKPYQNIRLHVYDDDITTVCLILTPENWKALHLTVHFPSQYPSEPPSVSIQSKINHPYVVGHRLMASILFSEGDYTAAYTLKTIAIQILSFFTSDTLDTTDNGVKKLAEYRSAPEDSTDSEPTYQCEKCRFGYGSRGQDLSRASATSQGKAAPRVLTSSTSTKLAPEKRVCYIQELPNEIKLQILKELDSEALAYLAQVWPRIKSVIAGDNALRDRELQCYVLKNDYREVNLGVGIAVAGWWHRPDTLYSEFDLVSEEAVDELGVRRPIHGPRFEIWLPLPISEGHWKRVKHRVLWELSKIAVRPYYPQHPVGWPAVALYGFMDNIVVNLNLNPQTTRWNRGREKEFRHNSTLNHPSEKAIKAYVHLIHLLICLATSPEGKDMVPAANKMINTFMEGKTSKEDVPNLNHLLIAFLISDVEMTDTLLRAIIAEAIIRDVVWLLDRDGAGLAELMYLEADEVSDYRLKKTFESGKGTYRQLMFAELFRRTIRSTSLPSTCPTVPPLTESSAYPSSMHEEAHISTSFATPQSGPPSPQSSSSVRPSLVQLRDELFIRRGAPTHGTAARLASELRRIHKIDDFPSFLYEMGYIALPPKNSFTAFLRSTITTSIDRGYSKAAITQEEPLVLRLKVDNGLDRRLVYEQYGWGGYELPDADEVKKKLRGYEDRSSGMSFFGAGPFWS